MHFWLELNLFMRLAEFQKRDITSTGILASVHTSATKDQIYIRQELLLPQLLQIYWIKDVCLTSSGFVEREIFSKVCKFS